jgi:hypothetical protein
MTDDHTLNVFGEPPIVGRSANVEAWRGYVSNFPDYVVYPRRIALVEETVAILGHTTGSHLGLSDEDESRMTLVWLAEVAGGKVRSWSLVDDTSDNRQRAGVAE